MPRKKSDKVMEPLAVRFFPEEIEQIQERSGEVSASTIIRTLTRSWLKGEIEVNPMTGKVTAKCSS